MTTAPGDKVWEFVYNDLGQPVETYNPFGSAAKSLAFQCNLPGGDEGKVNPNGTVETFGFDSRNRLTRRYLGTEATGGADLEEFLYELDAVGNITKTTELDGTAWTYAYDNRYRLTSAIAAEGTKKKCKETYVYDNGDNLLTKTTPLQENFDELRDDGWNGASTYVATKGYLEKESGALDAGNCRPQAEDNYQGWFSYRHGGASTARIHLREGWRCEPSPDTHGALGSTDVPRDCEERAFVCPLRRVHELSRSLQAGALSLPTRTTPLCAYSRSCEPVHP